MLLPAAYHRHNFFSLQCNLLLQKLLNMWIALEEMTTKLVPKQSILRKSRTSTFRSRKSENHQWQISILHFTCCEKLDVLVASSAQIWVNLTLRTGCWWTTFCTFFVAKNFMDFWPSNPAGEQIWTCFMNIDKVCNKNVFFDNICNCTISVSFLSKIGDPSYQEKFSLLMVKLPRPGVVGFQVVNDGC